MNITVFAISIFINILVGSTDIIQSFIDDILDQNITSKNILSKYLREYEGEYEFKSERDSLLTLVIEVMRDTLTQSKISNKEIEIISLSEKPELFDRIITGEDSGESYAIVVDGVVFKYILFEENRIQSMILMKKGDRLFFMKF